MIHSSASFKNSFRWIVLSLSGFNSSMSVPEVYGTKLGLSPVCRHSNTFGLRLLTLTTCTISPKSSHLVWLVLGCRIYKNKLRRARTNKTDSFPYLEGKFYSYSRAMNDPMVEILRIELATSDLHDRLSNAVLNLMGE